MPVSETLFAVGDRQRLQVASFGWQRSFRDGGLNNRHWFRTPVLWGSRRWPGKGLGVTT